MKELVDVNVPKPKGVAEVTTPEAKKPDLADRIVEVQEKAIVSKATTEAFGLTGQGGGGEQPESLAVQIVTNSMKQQAEAVKEMKENEKALQENIKEANTAKDTMQTAMLQDMLGRIESAQTKLNDSAKAAQATGAPMSAFEGYKQVKGELSSLVTELTKDKPAAEAVQGQGMSDATRIRLEELALQQQQVLAQITADNTRAREQFTLQMAEFQDNKAVRRLEYEDKKHFREEGLHGVSDLVAALGAGVSGQGGPAGATAAQPEAEEAEAGAYVSSFKCGVCGGEVPVEEGQTVAKCPNPSCNASFTIKVKE